ncbi:gamma carbonic anhydrase family protein [Microbacterium sp. NPDC091382]|uniref:gamma carbonic anhydrase family protein n=1 Tax=Microbacterium sp. NPDC091382 TaxID=3364210 RepID=UPI0037F79499
MTVSPRASMVSLPDAVPTVADSAFVAAGARVVGEVTLNALSSVWYNAVLRGDSAPIVIGARSNIQDGVAIHVDAAHGVDVGQDVSIGHNAVVHGCRIGDGTLIGMGAVVLSGAVIGAGCLVAGGAVVLEGTVIPDGSLVAGVPAKVRRELTAEERAGILRNAEVYLSHAGRHGSVA